jgi:RimJ/RimL family protein N-acetyltransferase
MLGDAEGLSRFFMSEESVSRSGIEEYLFACVDVLAVSTEPRNELAGAIFLTSAQPGTRQVFMSVFALPRFRRGRAFMEGVILGIDAAFDDWNLHRIRFDVMGVNLSQLSSLDRLAGVEREGTRRDWAFFDGQFVDAHLFSISRIGWMEMGQGWATRIRAAGERRAHADGADR